MPATGIPQSATLFTVIPSLLETILITQNKEWNIMPHNKHCHTAGTFISQLHLHSLAHFPSLKGIKWTFEIVTLAACVHMSSPSTGNIISIPKIAH
jgi:hypothetical protein